MLISHQSGSKSALFVLFFLKSMPFQRKLTSICLSLGSETISLLHCPNHPRHSPKHTSFAPFIRCDWTTEHKLPPHTHLAPLLWAGAATNLLFCPFPTLTHKKSAKNKLLGATFRAVHCHFHMYAQHCKITLARMLPSYMHSRRAVFIT